MYLFGEPGLEKDELAALIHFGSARRRGPMARVDCAELNPGRAEELLASTGEHSWLAKLDGGSLLLNNVHQVLLPRPDIWALYSTVVPPGQQETVCCVWSLPNDLPRLGFSERTDSAMMRLCCLITMCSVFDHVCVGRGWGHIDN